MAVRSRHQREFTGPHPNSFSLLAKNPSSKPADFLIQERIKAEEERAANDSIESYNRDFNIRNDWVLAGDQRIKRANVKRQIKSIMQQNEYALDLKREKLKALLANEEIEYMKEYDRKIETPIEKAARMRERAKQLREKRETDRSEFVKEMMDRRWRNQCEELRTIMSKRSTLSLGSERDEQLKIKHEIEQQRIEEDKYYKEMWENELQTKVRREEQDERDKIKRNKDTLKIIQEQMAAAEAKRQESVQIIEEEAKLLEEQAKLRAMEDERRLADKVVQQAAVREMLDSNIRLKLRRQAKTIQEELALDMKILEALLVETKNESFELMDKKRQRKEETLRYMAYLKEEMEVEKRRERELEAAVDAEVEKNWQRKIAQWRKERIARQTMMNEVMAARKLQVEYKLARAKEEKQKALIEHEQLLQSIEQQKLIGADEQSHIRKKQLKFRNDLLGQLNYNERLSEFKKDESHNEYVAGLQAEANYQARLRAELQRPDEKLHPARRKFGFN